MQRLRYRHPSLVLVGVASSFAVVGCGYMVGSPNLPEVRSVYVPIFTSESNRRGLEYLLRAVVCPYSQHWACVWSLGIRSITTDDEFAFPV